MSVPCRVVIARACRGRSLSSVFRTPESVDERAGETQERWLIFLNYSDICKILFAIILPPLGVFLERGCGADLLINICLTILGWIPGIIHALYVLPAVWIPWSYC